MRQQGYVIWTMLKERQVQEPWDGHAEDITYVGRLREVMWETRHVQGVTQGTEHVRERLRESQDGPRKGVKHMVSQFLNSEG